MELKDWDEKARYKVVVSGDKMYSIWPASQESPEGWREVGRTGAKQQCLDYIEEVWTDMRPLSLRSKMEEAARRIQQDAKR